VREIQTVCRHIHRTFITLVWTNCPGIVTNRTVKLNLKLTGLYLVTAVMAVASIPAQAQTVSDFSLPDVNTNSLRRRATTIGLSPRDYLHQVTAWYFGNEA
jgi:hypothetical protein